MRPLIGVSANRFAADPQRPVFKGMELHYGEACLLESLYAAGALPVIVPDLKTAGALAEFMERLDGLVLAGGADVSPESYGLKDFDARWPGDKVRDDYEIALFRAAEKADRPIFGVCRGLQLINVARGGTLFQDLTLEKKTGITHRDWDVYEKNNHEVRLEKGSWLEKLYGKPALRVNTVHHQGIRDLAPTMRAAAFAPDGVIEAIEDRDGRWVRAVQWHPEWARLHSQGLDDMEAAFRDFVAAAADKGKGPRRS